MSEATVTEMSQGVRSIFNADWGIAVSGIAGPGGGTEDKPVGTVWIAVVGPNKLVAKRLQLPCGRRRNKVAVPMPLSTSQDRWRKPLSTDMDA